MEALTLPPLPFGQLAFLDGQYNLATFGGAPSEGDASAPGGCCDFFRADDVARLRRAAEALAGEQRQRQGGGGGGGEGEAVSRGQREAAGEGGQQGGWGTSRVSGNGSGVSRRPCWRGWAGGQARSQPPCCT